MNLPSATPHTDFTTIPRLDMSLYTSGDEQAQSDFIHHLRKVCHEVGFFYLENHCIPPAQMQTLLTLAESFFALRQEEKDRIDISHSPHFRGYGKLNSEMTLGVADYKESYDFGPERAPHPLANEKPYLLLHGPNQWPASHTLTELHFKKTILQYIRQMQNLGRSLMQAMLLALDLPATLLDEQLDSDADDAYAILRLLHYPPASNTNPFGVGPHVDAGCLVFLLQDNIGGLQVQNHQQQWIDAPPMSDCFIVNIGQMLELWSNHYFQATPHRVINQSQQHRYSAPFFFEPRLGTIVSPLPIFNKQANSNIKSIIYGEQMLTVARRSFEQKQSLI